MKELTFENNEFDLLLAPDEEEEIRKCIKKMNIKPVAMAQIDSFIYKNKYNVEIISYYSLPQLMFHKMYKRT